jgi:hypothetical protein
LVRRLDRWVGRLVEFEKASRSYRFLLTTPALMDAETARRKSEFHGLMQRLEDMERAEAERLGMPQAMRDVESTKATLQRLEGQLAEDDQRVRTVEEELAALDREQGRFHEEALGRLKVFLSQAETPLLERRAAATPDRADDEVTLRIRVLSEEIAGIEPQLARQKQMSASTSRLSDGLGHLARRFEQTNFHESRSFFADGYDIARSVELYRTEVLSRDAFWDEIKRQQERLPTDFEKRASETIAAAMNGPMSGALAEAMLNVAGAALGQSVGRSMSRRRAVGEGPGAAEHGKRWVRKDPPTE